MESGQELLKRILFGGKLTDKLAGGSAFSEWDWQDSKALMEVIESPGREGLLAPRSGVKSAFPRHSEILKSDQARGRLLHFFANHELLAIETMAYVLLKFPDAPESFRKGVFRVLQEEQRHFGAYLERMEEYGVAFGEVPLNLYFWNTLKGINRPLDFVVQMSLTFEQANLDFALEYATLFETQMNDPKTAELLRTVHDDEIRHVEHGWRWFKEWRDPEAGSDFEAYQEALPFPMTPRRARGGRFFASDSRAKAGMTKEFIEEVKIVGGSRGRVPNYYFFNPQCEVEQSLPTLPGPLKKKVADLEPLVLWLAKEEDCVELAKRPARDFLSRLHQVKGEIPEMLTKEDEFSRYTAFDEFRPWGFSSSAWNRMGRIGKKFRSPPAFDSKLHENFLFSKAYWKRILNTEGAVIDSSDSLHQWLRENSESTGTFLVKSAINTSGRGHLRLEGIQLRDPVLIRKLGKRIESGEQLVIEPFFEKLADFSVQYELSSKGRLTEFEPRLFRIDEFYQYRGAILGRAGLGDPYDSCMNQIEREKDRWRPVHLKVVDHLKSLNYSGPFGIDSIVAKGEQAPFIVPVIEVNVRYTMGRIAHEIENAVKRSGAFRFGVWNFVNETDLIRHSVRSFKELEDRWSKQYGERFFPTTPSDSALGTWTYALMNPVNAADPGVLP